MQSRKRTTSSKRRSARRTARRRSSRRAARGGGIRDKSNNKGNNKSNKGTFTKPKTVQTHNLPSSVTLRAERPMYAGFTKRNKNRLRGEDSHEEELELHRNTLLDESAKTFNAPKVLPPPLHPNVTVRDK